MRDDGVGCHLRAVVRECVDLAAEEREKIKADIENRLTEATREAARDLWKRLHKAVAHVSERLSDKDKIFRDTLIANLRSLNEVLPALNISGDPELERLRAKVAGKLLTVEPHALRDDERKRASTARAAKSLLKEIEQHTDKDPDAAVDPLSVYTGTK